MARALHLAGDLSAGLEEARKASRIEEALAAADPAPAARLRLATSYTAEGFLLGASKRTRESVERFRQATAVLEPLQSAGEEFQLQLGLTYSDFGSVLCSAAPVAGLVPDPKGCLELYRRSNAIEERLARADPSNLRLQRSVFAGAVQVGDAFVSLRDLPSAIDYFRRACAAGERLAAMDAANLQAQSDFAVACERLGTSLAQTGGAAEALRLLDRSLRILEPILAADKGNLGTRARVANTRIGLGFAHAALGVNSAFSTDVRAGHWREARAGFHDGLVFWAEMRDTGMASGTEGDIPDQLAREIAKCDEALTRRR
jgi:tetratricopeptide (TPR) repeat protein